MSENLKRPSLEQILRAVPMLARANRELEPCLLAQGPDAAVSSVTVNSPALTDGKSVPLTAALRDELLRRIDSGTLGYVELDVPMLAYEQRAGEPNRNFVEFRGASMRAIGRTGQGKPFLRDHRQGDSMARGGTLVESSTEVPAEGHYQIRQVARLTEPWAVALYLRGNMTTVSIGWIPTGPVLCSACDAPVGEKCGGWWMHWPGDRLKEVIDEDDNRTLVESKEGTIVVTWIYTAAELIETSGVPVPGVPTAEMDQLRAQLSASFPGFELSISADDPDPSWIGGRKSPPALAARSVDPTTTPAPETKMADQNPTAADLAKARRLLAVALSLPEEHRQHAAGLDDAEREMFLGLGAADRATAAKAALDADPIVFAGKLTGVEIGMSEGSKALKMAQLAEQGAETNKRNEEALARAATLADDQEVSSIRAARLAHLQGSDEVHTYLVRSLRKGGGSPELIEAALKALAGASESVRLASKAPGANEGTDPAGGGGDALAAWERGLAAYAKANSIQPDVAAIAFLGTAEGRQLKAAYDATRGYGQAK